MRLVIAAAALAATGCFGAGYVAQAVGGQAAILHAARPISTVMADPEAPGRVRHLLQSVRAIKRYGLSQGLEPTRSYERYADLHRPAAVWVVQGCAPLAFDVRRWRFPFVGTVPYLGFFDPGAAERYAGALAERERLDVEVRTAGAYSTLGWFRDPVLSTMIPSGPEARGELANVVLHESVHATVYVNDQSAFDESLASFVADRLTRAWLLGALGAASAETRAWIEAHERWSARRQRLHRAYEELDALYRSTVSDDEKRAGKGRVLDALQRELKLRRPLNNAALAGYRAYDTGTAAFERLLVACDGSWPRFLAAVGRLRPGDFERPQQEDLDPVIDRLAAQGCAAAAAPPARAPMASGAEAGGGPVSRR